MFSIVKHLILTIFSIFSPFFFLLWPIILWEKHTAAGRLLTSAGHWKELVHLGGVSEDALLRVAERALDAELGLFLGPALVKNFLFYKIMGKKSDHVSTIRWLV